MIRSIKTRKQYETSLARINTLMTAGPGTPEASELWSLSILVLRYEFENKMEPTCPVDAAGGRALSISPALETVRQLANIWHLTMTEACALASLTDAKLTATSLPYVSAETRLRIELLIEIFAHLVILFSAPLSADWPTLPNKGELYGGRRPIDVMIDGGLPTMNIVRRELISLRGDDSLPGRHGPRCPPNDTRSHGESLESERSDCDRLERANQANFRSRISASRRRLAERDLDDSTETIRTTRDNLRSDG